MRVKFIKSPTAAPWLMAYSTGQIAEVDDAKAKAMIQAGVAEAVKEKKKPKPKIETASVEPPAKKPRRGRPKKKG